MRSPPQGFIEESVTIREVIILIEINPKSLLLSGPSPKKPFILLGSTPSKFVGLHNVIVYSPGVSNVL